MPIHWLDRFFFTYFIASGTCLSAAWFCTVWQHKTDRSRWAILCCPLFTLLALIAKYRSVLDRIIHHGSRRAPQSRIGMLFQCGFVYVPTS